MVGRDHTLGWWLDTDGWGRERFIATLFGIFAVLALVLAATGLYSVVSFGVTQRTQELGIRMALGARPASVVKLVLGSTAAMLSVGVAVGLTLSVILNRVVASWAGGSSRDPLTLIVAASILFLVAGDCLRLAGVARRVHRSHACTAFGIARRNSREQRGASVG